MEDLKEAAKRIFLRTLDSLEIEKLIRERVKVDKDALMADGERIAFSSFKEVVVIGIGKASARMGAIIEEMLEGHVKRGLLVTNRRSSARVRSEVIVAGHPLPDAESFRAGEEIINLIRSCGRDSLIVFLISGGGSSLVEAPIIDEVTPEDIKDLNQVLINSGAAIREINVVRKHLSSVKGGRLGFLARNSNWIALYVSDVNEGDLRSIASNPLLPDEATLKDFYRVIERYQLLSGLPSSLRAAIEDRSIPDLPRAWPVADRAHLCLLLLDNKDALNAAAEVATAFGYEVEIELNQPEGDYREVAQKLIERLLHLRRMYPDIPLCLVSGGEVSCPVRGNGLGGRNQEFVLYSAAQLAISDFKEAAVLSCGTDGVDGNSFADGAVADAEMIRNAERLGLVVSQFLQANDSHSFFRERGGMVVSGPTENNVRDIRLLLTR